MKVACWLLVLCGCARHWELPVEPLGSDEAQQARAHRHAQAQYARQVDRALGLPPATKPDDVSAARDEGRWLFETDTPWHGSTPVTVTPLLRTGTQTAQATRCVACHVTGGAFGGGAFGDRTFEGDSDDVTSATVRLPPMLAGAAVLELIARADEAPFGWSPGAPRTVLEWVTSEAKLRLGETPSDEERNQLVVAIASVPLPSFMPPPVDSLRGRLQHGAELFQRYGCATCHTPTRTVERFQLTLAGRNTLNVEAWLRDQTQTAAGPITVELYSDLKPHDVGTGERIVTPPLWGCASRALYLHDGRASTVLDAVLAHAGEATDAAKRFAEDQVERRDLVLLLQSLSRPTHWESPP